MLAAPFTKAEEGIGLYLVKVGDKYGFIDKRGKFVLRPQFERARRFSEGLAPVKVGSRRTGKWGFIDKTGKLVIKPQFDAAFRFSEGLAEVHVGKSTRYIDKAGNLVWKKETSSRRSRR